MSVDVDFVLTYLDSTDPRWIAERLRYDSGFSDTMNGPERYRNPGNLRYWFRAIEQYAPWVRKIHLVTYGHVPEWLNSSHNKLNVVTHSSFIPNELLPTFSSRTIEFNLDRIPGLSERFINFNDDMFLNGPVSERDFFSGGNPVLELLHAPVVPREDFSSTKLANMVAVNSRNDWKVGVKKSLDGRNGLRAFCANLLMAPFSIQSRSLLGFREDHLPQALTKRLFAEARALYAGEITQSEQSKFRKRGTVNIWLLHDHARATGAFAPRSRASFGSVVNLVPTESYEGHLASDRRVLCFNDSTATNGFEIEIERLNRALRKRFSTPSSFEMF